MQEQQLLLACVEHEASERWQIFVGKINLDDIVPQDVERNVQNSEGEKNAALWSNIVTQYKDRSTCDEELNVHKFIVLQMFKKEKFAPKFI
eukprot:14804167-Ditylum_brightwellii.AAC.1